MKTLHCEQNQPFSSGGVTKCEFSEPLLLPWVKTTGQIQNCWPTFTYINGKCIQKTRVMHQLCHGPSNAEVVALYSEFNIHHSPFFQTFGARLRVFCPLNRVVQGPFPHVWSMQISFHRVWKAQTAWNHPVTSCSAFFFFLRSDSHNLSASDWGQSI